MHSNSGHKKCSFPFLCFKLYISFTLLYPALYTSCHYMDNKRANFSFKSQRMAEDISGKTKRHSQHNLWSRFLLLLSFMVVDIRQIYLKCIRFPVNWDLPLAEMPWIFISVIDQSFLFYFCFCFFFAVQSWNVDYLLSPLLCTKNLTIYKQLSCLNAAPQGWTIKIFPIVIGGLQTKRRSGAA